MAVKLNKRAFNHAKELVSGGKVVLDERDAWSEHQPSAQQENEFIRRHGWDAYGKWYLGIDDEEDEQLSRSAAARLATRLFVAGIDTCSGERKVRPLPVSSPASTYAGACSVAVDSRTSHGDGRDCRR